MIKNLLLSGGGIKGLLTIGSLQYLINEKYFNIDECQLFAGISVGSIISLLLCLNYSIDEIISLSRQIKFENYEINHYDLSFFIDQYGFDNGDKLILTLENILYEKLQVKDISFLDLYNHTNKNFIVQACNLSTYKLSTFSHIHSPDMSVILAIRMSCSIPIYFTPIIYKDEYYVDGYIITNIPILENLSNINTLCISIQSSNIDNNFNNIACYFKKIIDCYNRNNQMKVSYVNHIILYDDDYFLFSISMEKINSLIIKGYEQTKEYYISKQNEDNISLESLLISSDSVINEEKETSKLKKVMYKYPSPQKVDDNLYIFICKSDDENESTSNINKEDEDEVYENQNDDDNDDNDLFSDEE